MSTYASFAEWAAAPHTKKVVAIELTVTKISDSSALTLYFATDSKESWDGVHRFAPFVDDIPRVERRADGVLGGKSLVAYGDLVLTYEADRKAGKDPAITWAVLFADYVWEGGTIVAKLGGPGLAWANWQTIIDGYLGRPAQSEGQATISLKTKTWAALNTEVPPNVYGADQFAAWGASTAYSAGYFVSPSSDNGHYYECTTGGVSGVSEPSWGTTDNATTPDGTATWTCRSLPASVVGRAVPAVYGEPKDYRPQLIYDDETNSIWIFQFSDASLGSCQSVDAVHVDGYAETSGVTYTFSSNLVGNFVKFTGTKPNSVTLDFKGLKFGGSYYNRPGDLFSQWLQTLGGVSSGSIDSAAVSAFNTAVNAIVAAPLDRKQSLADALDWLLEGLLARWGDGVDGKYTIRQMAAPTGTADLELSAGDILRNGESDQAVSTLQTEPVDQIIWKMTVAGDRCWSVNTSPSDSVGADRRARLAEDYREREASDDTVKTTYGAAAGTDRVETRLASLADCATLAALHLALRKVPRDKAKFETLMGPAALELLDEVKITNHRVVGFSDGRSGRFVAQVSDYGKGTIAPEVWL